MILIVGLPKILSHYSLRHKVKCKNFKLGDILLFPTVGHMQHMFIPVYDKQNFKIFSNKIKTVCHGIEVILLVEL